MDQQFMLRQLRSEETISKASRQMTFGLQAYYLVSGIYDRTKEIIAAIDQELKN